MRIMPNEVTQVLLTLHEVPPHGAVQVITRVTSDDHELLKRASIALGIRLSQFQRMVLVQSARKVLEETQK